MLLGCGRKKPKWFCLSELKNDISLLFISQEPVFITHVESPVRFWAQVINTKDNSAKSTKHLNLTRI